MASFSDQAGQLRGSLIEAGLPSAAATILTNIFCNGVQTLRHSGEVLHDSTPQGLRQVSPDDRTHRLTNLDFRDGDPDYRRPRSRSSEDREQPVQQGTVLGTLPPQQTQSSFRVRGGAYTSVEPAGDTASVNLRMAGPGDCLFRDAANNTLVAKNLRAEGDASDLSRLRFFIEPRPDEVVFKLSTVNTAAITVVTDVQLIGNRIVVTKKTIQAWPVADAEPSVIPVAACPS